MVSILGRWEIGYHAPITEQWFWSLPIRDFGVTDWNMTPVSGIRNREHQIELNEWDKMEDYFAANPDKKRVFIEPRTKHENPDTIWLHEYDHPEDCVYVFGTAGYNPTKLHYREGLDDIVSIKTSHDKGVLWADQCMCIVLYERAKQWQ